MIEQYREVNSRHRDDEWNLYAFPHEILREHMQFL